MKLPSDTGPMTAEDWRIWRAFNGQCGLHPGGRCILPADDDHGARGGHMRQDGTRFTALAKAVRT